MTEPSNGEVMRRLDEVSRQLLQLAQDMRDDRNTAADTYVRKDVFTPTHEATTRRIEDLERESAEREKAQDAFRRQIIVTVIAAALPAVLALVLAINNVLNAGATP